MTYTLYDTTLRDGSQCEDVQFNTPDKIKIALKLDDFGFHYIEGGWPGANPVDSEFFQEIKNYHLKNARIAAFGSTHHPANTPESDPTIKALIASDVPVITIFGKSSEKHVKDALRIKPSRNLEIISNSVSILNKNCDTVFYDAEHFFDGYKANPEYTLSTLKHAYEAGAKALILCDTNGGTLPHEISAIVHDVIQKLPDATIGIHAHNDCEMAVANTIAAIQAGATHIQGTINGIGERCGNANLCSIIPIMELKLNKKCLPEGKLEHLSTFSHYVAEVANISPFTRQAFVGKSAFAHKGGVHVNAINKDSSLYEHMKPELVGNGQRILITELSGRSNIVSLAKRFGFNLDKDEPVVKGLFHELKKNASMGYDYASAEASMELLLLRKLARRGVRDFFTLQSLRVLETKDKDNLPIAEATIMLNVEGTVEHTAATGLGPINAIDTALRKALAPFYSRISDMHLQDFKVRVLSGSNKTAHIANPDMNLLDTSAETNNGTASVVRVLIESADSHGSWVTVGVSYDIIEASWQALADSVTYKLYRDEWQDHTFED